MVSPAANLNHIERRLRQVLVVYTNARTRGGFLEAILAVHNALEDALNMHLGEQASELTFSQKARAVLPQYCEQFEVDKLNKQRNFYAHPKQQFKDSDIRQTAIGFVDLVLAAWRDLFGSCYRPN